MKYDIHTLPVVPYIIAERAVWNMLEARHKNLTPLECSKIVAELSPKLVQRSEIIYSTNEQWRKQLHKAKDERFFLEMFMEHWTLPLLQQMSIPKE